MTAFSRRCSTLTTICLSIVALALASIACAGPDVPVPVNLCSVARVTASSYEGDRFAPGRAVDAQAISIEGLRENAWCSAKEQTSKGQWLAVQFAREEQFTGVQVWYRVIAGEHRFVPQTVTVQSSSDGETWDTLVSRSDNVPRMRSKPDAEPRNYNCSGKARFLRLLFEDGAQPDEVYDAVELVELIVTPPDGWQPPVLEAGPDVTFTGTRELDPVLPGEQPVEVREANGIDEGEFIVTLPGEVPVTIRKPLGEIGGQEPVELPQFPDGHFERMLTSKDDVWGLQVLDKPGDPSFENVAGFTYPYKYPFCFVGAKEYPVEPCVTWDGSVAYNETGDYISFGFSGERIPKRNAYDVRRGLLDMTLPATEYVYLDRALGVGWEQMVVCEQIEGQLYTMVRLRLRNFGGERRKLEFSVFPFVPYSTSKPRALTFNNIRLKGNLAYVGPGLAKVGFWLSDVGNVREDRIAYNLDLQPGEDWQLVIKLNGDHSQGGPEEVFREQVVPRSIFASLVAQKESWDEFHSSGMQIVTPEDKLNGILQATAAHTFVDIDGDIVKGGAFHAYDIHYPLLTMRIVRYCLDWGYFDNARRYLEYLLAEPKNPADGGPKSLFVERGTSPVYDGGYFLQVLARYHQYTRDDSFILAGMAEIEGCFDYILKKRAASLAKEPEGSPSRGLILGRTTGDLSHASYAYCNDAPCWRGMVEMAKVLADVGKRTGDGNLASRAVEIAREAEGYKQDILRSIRQTTIHTTDPPFVPIVVGTKEPYENMHLNDLVSYANFRMYNHLLDAGILDEETTRWILDYRKTRGGELLGMIRWGDQVDNFLCEDVQWEKLRLERIREFLLNFYAYIEYDLAPGVWTGYEEFSLDPMAGEDPPGRTNLKHSWRPTWETRMNHGYEQTRVSANIPELARFMVVQAERDRDLLWLGRAIPRHWLDEGKQVVVRDAPTRWGNVSYQIDSRVDSLKCIEVTLKLTGEDWPRINLRLRHPSGARLTKALLNGKVLGDIEGETISLPAGLAGSMRVETYWEAE